MEAIADLEQRSLIVVVFVAALINIDLDTTNSNWSKHFVATCHHCKSSFSNSSTQHNASISHNFFQGSQESSPHFFIHP